MPIDLTCSCGKQLRVADEFAGQQGRCPVCGVLMEIPHQEAIVSGAELPPLGAAAPAEIASPEDAITDQPIAPADSFATDFALTRPTYKLFSPGAIGLVAFLAGPMGALFLLAINYWRMGKRTAAWMTLAVSVITLTALTVFLLSLPEGTPGVAIGLPLFLVLWGAARVLQGGAYEVHRQNGGETASAWSATKVAVLGLVVYFGVFLSAFLIYDSYLDESRGKAVAFGNGEEVYYAKGATEADARALGAFLREEGFFDGRSAKTVRVAQDGNRVVISFVVQKWVLKDAQVQQDFRAIGQSASQRAFGGRPVTVELCDEYFAVKKKL